MTAVPQPSLPRARRPRPTGVAFVVGLWLVAGAVAGPAGCSAPQSGAVYQVFGTGPVVPPANPVGIRKAARTFPISVVVTVSLSAGAGEMAATVTAPVRGQTTRPAAPSTRPAASAPSSLERRFAVSVRSAFRQSNLFADIAAPDAPPDSSRLSVEVTFSKAAYSSEEAYQGTSSEKAQTIRRLGGAVIEWDASVTVSRMAVVERRFQKKVPLPERTWRAQDLNKSDRSQILDERREQASAIVDFMKELIAQLAADLGRD
jgi:hypothetical protein